MEIEEAKEKNPDDPNLNETIKSIEENFFISIFEYDSFRTNYSSMGQNGYLLVNDVIESDLYGDILPQPFKITDILESLGFQQGSSQVPFDKNILFDIDLGRVIYQTQLH